MTAGNKVFNIGHSSDPIMLEKEKTYLNKLNMILVQVPLSFP